MSEKTYDYPYFDLSKPFTIDGVNVKVKVQVRYDFADGDIVNGKYSGINWNLLNADDETQPVKLTIHQWKRIDDLIGLLNTLYYVTEVVGHKANCLTIFKQTIADEVKTKTFGDLFDATTKNPKYCDDLNKALTEVLQFCNRNKSATFTGRRDTSDDGFTFGDICKDMLWPFL